ncbi:MAG: hypothetical protein MJ252_15770 [archaeon]|nr:hypothetical protein [archaeon]
MKKCQILSSVTGKIFNEMTNYKNSLENKENFNKNILLNLAYITECLKIKEKEDSGKVYPEIEENEILDYIVPTKKLSYTYEKMAFSNNQNDNFLDQYSTKATKIDFNEFPIIPEDEDDMKSTDIFSFIFSDIEEDEDIFFPNDQQKHKLSKLELDRTGQLNFNMEQTETMKEGENKEMQKDIDSVSESVISTEPNQKSSFFGGLFKKFGKKSNRAQELDEIKKQNICNEFRTCLPQKVILKQLNDMNDYYLRYMLKHFTFIYESSQAAKGFEQNMLFKLYKKFILKVGITDKKIYEDLLRNIIYQNKNEKNPEFEDFLNCFNKVLKLGNDLKFLKYSFLFNIIHENLEEEIVDISHIHKFFNLIQCNLVYEEDIFKIIKTNLIDSYYELYPSKNKTKFKVQGILTCLEEFFDGKTNYK